MTEFRKAYSAARRAFAAMNAAARSDGSVPGRQSAIVAGRRSRRGVIAAAMMRAGMRAGADRVVAGQAAAVVMAARLGWPTQRAPGYFARRAAVRT